MVDILRVERYARDTFPKMLSIAMILTGLFDYKISYRFFGFLFYYQQLYLIMIHMCALMRARSGNNFGFHNTVPFPFIIHYCLIDTFEGWNRLALILIQSCINDSAILEINIRT